MHHSSVAASDARRHELGKTMLASIAEKKRRSEIHHHRAAED